MRANIQSLENHRKATVNAVVFAGGTNMTFSNNSNLALGTVNYLRSVVNQVFTTLFCFFSEQIASKKQHCLTSYP